MLVPVHWMKDFYKIDKEMVEVSDKLSSTGTHIEQIIDYSKDLDGIVVGKILEIEKHPNADRLSLVKVDFGEVNTVVCGASNMKEGDFVPYATLGTVMPGGMEIQPISLQGIESQGMLCSYQELGFSESVIPQSMREGLAILTGDFEPGTPFFKALDLEEILEVEVTPNRPDCQSILGIARETAASFYEKMEEPEVEIFTEEENISDYFNSVEIQSDKALRYVARICKDIKIQQSPQWMKNRLMQAGMRPINNIVDITNYVMLETGQPLHAFDLRDLPTKKIVVRMAEEEEKLVTLDGNERTLTKEDLVITDGEKPVALAGVMGGENSEVKSDTTTILVESASFDKATIRRTSRRQSLRSEASGRFERGVSPELALYAADRVCELIEETNSGTVVSGVLEDYPNPVQNKELTVSYDFISKRLGEEISKEEVLKHLEDLDFTVVDLGEKVKTTAPLYRQDISIPEDIVEEVGRLYGFQNITPKPIVGEVLQGRKSKRRKITDEGKKLLYGLGFYEMLTYSFISPKSYEKMGQDIPKNIIKIENPLGESYSVMRTTILPNLLEVLKRNETPHAEKIDFYEIGKVFFKESGEYVEKDSLVLGSLGSDFFEMKARIKLLLEKLSLTDLSFEKESENPTFHPGRCANINVHGKSIGTFGEISYDVKDRYDFKGRVYMAELDFETILSYYDFETIYEPIVKFPKIERDLAFVVDVDLPSIEIINSILDMSDLIIDVKLFDIYTGSGVEEDKKSVAYAIFYQAKDRTLTDEEVEKIQEKILEEMKKKFGATLRA